MVGEFAERNLQKVYAKKAFIGCAGISANAVTTEIANEVNLNELHDQTGAMRSSHVLADYTKVVNSSFRTCSIGRNAISLRTAADPAALKKITDGGVVVHQVLNDEGETTR